MIKAPYGSWTSPVTSDLIVGQTIGLGGGGYEGDDFYWMESRPQEGGRQVVVKRDASGTETDMFPAPFNARTRVHEYGGAAWIVAGGVVYFSNFADQQIWAADGGAPRQVTNEPVLRFANATFDAPRGRLVCVVESHGEGESEPENWLGAVDLTSGEVTKLTGGHDFFSSPALSPDGSQLAWVTWDHPDMPWDATQLWLAEVAADGTLGDAEVIAGGDDEPAQAIQQPRFAPDGTLWFVTDREGWWNLHRYQDNRADNMCEMDAEFGVPHWQFGISTYGFDARGEVICVINESNECRLARLEKDGTLAEIETRFTLIGGLNVDGDRCVFVGASPTEFSSLIELDLVTQTAAVVKRSSDVDLDPGYLSTPRAITYTSANESVAHAFFYPPANKDFEGTPEALPPLVVMLHGGPTSATHGALSLAKQYWTSRGFAVLDVNYRGSTGYGRQYRNQLRGQWGVVDVEDCVYGAQYVVDQGLVDTDRLAIRGGSAGGYTTLAALAFEKTFSAGASHYGVGDLEALAKDTHKFESRYLDSMIGRYPEDIEIYKARSPINHVDGLDCPTIFFQGLEDKVVPPNQAETMVAALKDKGIPVAYVPFEGEQHGFRRAENIKRALDLELYFYSRVFDFTPADDIDPVPIDNLDTNSSR